MAEEKSSFWIFLVEFGEAEETGSKFLKCKGCGKWALMKTYRMSNDGSEVVVCEKCGFSNKRLKGIF